MWVLTLGTWHIFLQSENVFELADVTAIFDVNLTSRKPYTMSNFKKQTIIWTQYSDPRAHLVKMTSDTNGEWNEWKNEWKCFQQIRLGFCELKNSVINDIDRSQHNYAPINWPEKFCKRYRGYYTVARRYEFYVRVARTISHEWAKRTSEILFLPREHKIHMFEPTCNVLFIIWRNQQKQKAGIMTSLNDTTLTKVRYGKYATHVPDQVAYGIYEWFSSQ